MVGFRKVSSKGTLEFRMPAKSSSPTLPLPRSWTSRVKSAILQVISLAEFTMAHTRGWAANSPNSRIRLKADLDRAHQEIALLREELRIHQARMAQLPPHRRPYYPAVLRQRFLASSTGGSACLFSAGIGRDDGLITLTGDYLGREPALAALPSRELPCLSRAPRFPLSLLIISYSLSVKDLRRLPSRGAGSRIGVPPQPPASAPWASSKRSVF